MGDDRTAGGTGFRSFVSRPRALPALGAAILLGLALIVYLPAIRGGYVWDDDMLLTNNPNIRTFAGLVDTWIDPTSNTDYFPLTHTSWWLEFRLWGLNPLVFHFNNVLLHVGNGILFWLILRHLAVPGAWAAAAIFLVHPLHVESVAWVSERKNVLSGLLCLLSVWSFLQSALPVAGATPRRRRLLYGLSLFFYTGALFAKPMTMAAAAVLPLLIWWKRGRLTRHDALATAPFFVLAAPMAALTIWVQYYHVHATGEHFTYSLPQRTILAGRALWFYLDKLVWPRDLTFAYAKWVLDAGLWRNCLYPAGAAAAIVTLGLARRRIGRGPLVGAAVFVIMLSPALGFINVFWHKYYFVADHMPYLASLGLIAPAVALAAQGAVRLGPWGRPTACGALAVTVGLLGLLTWQQAGIYKDAETIWTDTLRKNPTSWMANNNLGNIRAARGQAQEAIRYYREALRLYPEYDKPHFNLGLVLQGQGSSEEAIFHFREALRINPRYPEAHFHLGRALDELGRTEEADSEYQKALGFDPD